jgi:hypothetical protein
MPASSPSAPPLDVGAALRDGWAAFQRAPWVFIGFTLLVSALGLSLSALELALTPAPGDLPALPSPARVLCQLASLALSLWAVVGLVRGAWIALEGHRPRFGELLRWDGPAIVRVLLATLLLSLILTVVALPLLGLMAVALAQMVQIDFPLGGSPILRGLSPSPGGILLFVLAWLTLLAVLLYAQVNQHFLVQLASLRGRGAVGTLAEGRAVVDRHWWPVLGLVALESVLILAGILALVVGLFVAVPVVACVSTAAYRQLFGPAGPAGELPSA